MTTLLRRLIVPALVFFVWAPVAHAWSWPVRGTVLEPFAYDEAHPYAAGQHRGIDIGADAAGEPVLAPAAGTVSFAGTVPTSGKSVTIETADGYAVTLTHLGSTVVAKGVAVAEGDEVGTIGPSGDPETDGPYVHLGIRVAADPNGYVDPLSLLPAPQAETGGGDSGTTTTQPSAGSGSPSSTAPASAPAPVTTVSPPAEATRGSTVQASGAHGSRHQRPRAQTSSAVTHPHRSAQRPQLSQPAQTERRAPRHPRLPNRRVSESASRRPVVEAAPPRARVDLGAGHELRPSVYIAHPTGHRRPASPVVLLGLVVNGAAAFVAVTAALVAMRRRRHGSAVPIRFAQVLHLPPPALDRDVRQAA